MYSNPKAISYDAEKISNLVWGATLGQIVDVSVTASQITDPALATLWATAEVALNEIQLYLEMHTEHYGAGREIED